MKLSKISARNPTFENKNKFKAFKNLYNKLSREMKKMYYQDQIIKHQGDAKKSWELIREATGSKKNDNFCPDKLNIDGGEITGNSNIANAFNSHLTSVILSPLQTAPQMNFYLI